MQKAVPLDARRQARDVAKVTAMPGADDDLRNAPLASHVDAPPLSLETRRPKISRALASFASILPIAADVSAFR